MTNGSSYYLVAVTDDLAVAEVTTGDLPVSGVDRLAPGVTDESLWVRLAAETGEHSGGEFVTADPVYGVSILDRGQVVVFSGGQAALLSR